MTLKEEHKEIKRIEKPYDPNEPMDEEALDPESSDEGEPPEDLGTGHSCERLDVVHMYSMSLAVHSHRIRSAV